MSVIEITGLRKTYRTVRGPVSVALDGLDLTVESGGVFGFLGPNGSGKTTTIRCLLGLSRPSAGACRIFGHDSATELHLIADKIGALVEAPALFATFSAAKNLELLAGTADISRTRIDQVLDTVGLWDRRRDPVKSYSLGMRQRLAIAAALLKDPQLLILDEPANGLDPAGIREVRSLLRRLGDDGRTVFVSSHILSEVQQTCDRVAILARGRCVVAGDVSEVLARGRSGHVLVRIADVARAHAVLSAVGFTTSITGNELHVTNDAHDAALISEALASHGLYPSELRPIEADLETVFLQLTAASAEEAA